MTAKRETAAAVSFFNIQTVNTKRRKSGENGKGWQISIQFVERKKSFQKGVDKRERRWYDNKAVARESKRKEPRNRMNRGFRGEKGMNANLLTKNFFKKSFKKLLTNA